MNDRELTEKELDIMYNVLHQTTISLVEKHVVGEDLKKVIKDIVAAMKVGFKLTNESTPDVVNGECESSSYNSQSQKILAIAGEINDFLERQSLNRAEITSILQAITSAHPYSTWESALN